MASILHNQEKLLAQVTANFENSDTILKSLQGNEGISELFEFRAVFSSSSSSVDLEQVLGSGITITFKSETQERYIDGIIAEFSQGQTKINEDNTSTTEYTAVIRPSLWLLTLDKNYLIFQGKTAIDIIKQILKDGGIKDIEDKTRSCGKVTRDYCVQYGESSFNFISRLMEDEGIFYYFKHAKGKHTLVLADSTHGYSPAIGVEKVDFIQGINSTCPLNKIFNTKITTAVNTGSYSAADYNYTISQTSLFSKLDSQWTGQNMYDYPGGFEKLDDGNKISELRVQQLELNHKLFSASSTAANLTPGHSFEVVGHYADKFNQKYVAYRVKHSFAPDKEGGFIYKNDVLAFEAKTEFRPPRITPKPRIYGSQTAVVTCPSGEEIFRNEYCCVKVHFYWDQVGKKSDTDNSSCWIRVAQLLAGSGWGAIFVPRVGQEVVVTFLNGDPDKPLITGCVYNDKFMPAYSDKEAMKTSLKTVTFTDDSGFNEFRFNDEKDNEEIYVHAQKDVYVDIVNSRTTDIEESDDTLTLFKGSRSIFLKSDEGNAEVKHTMEITKGDQVVNINEGNLKYTITKGNAEITLTEGNRTYLMDKGDDTVTLKEGNRTITLSKGDLKYDVTGNCTLKVSGDITIKADGNINIEAGKKISIKSGQDFTEDAGTAMKIKSKTDTQINAGTNLKAEAKLNMELKSLAFKATATMNMDLNANMMVNVKGTVSTKIEGATVQINGMGAIKQTAPLIALGGMIQLG